jgi:hypothetical protein
VFTALKFMLNRGMSRSSGSSSFSDWLEKQKAAERGENNPPEQQVSIFSRLTSIQDSFTNQLQELSGSLPEAGPLSASFRARITNAIYLFIASGVFAVLAVVIGVPTLVVRPIKFVLCMTISTLLAAASVVVMQTPSVFVSNIFAGGVTAALPVVLLLLSLLFTLYVTIFVHRYLSILFAGALQAICMLYYLASFIPGGTQGVMVLLRTTYAVALTAATPIYYMAKSAVIAILSKLCS